MNDALTMQEAQGAGEIPQYGGCGLLAVRAMSDEVFEQLEVNDPPGKNNKRRDVTVRSSNSERNNKHAYMGTSKMQYS